MAPNPRAVNTIPSHDAVLRRVVDRLTADDAPKTAAQLATSLRPLYPRVAVFERQLSGEGRRLYVYRDGHYEPDRRDPWWTEPGTPCVRVSVRDGRLTSVTGSWADLMRAPAEDLVGRPFMEFVLPEARAIAGAMFEAVSEEEVVRSEALVARPDGTTVFIEFRASRLENEIEVCYRPI